MDPFVVGQKTHLVNGQLGYEAQLVNAVVQATGAIRGRFHYEYRGEKERMECRVGAVINGESEITWNEWLCISDVTVKNSPLWKTNPKQQLDYLQVKYWARAHTPGAILGVYTPDELEDRQERVINPAAIKTHVSISKIPAAETEVIVQDNHLDKWVSDFRQRIDDADSTEETTLLRKEIEDKSQTLGIDLYTELKGKVVKRHHRLNAVNRIENLFNNLPPAGSAEATQKFLALENALNAAKVHLGELHEAYSTTLTDMKPEYR
ncbi:recombinase RecT [Atlantibacter hermannii]|uniref:recombinase RecT n=1 Tax=Atlantibacter hermannii TaxID=565 RepID=UPI00254A28A6|nr:recombinase RecT [Atlantibacter hermannii]